MLSETRARRCRESARQNLAGNPELSLQNSLRLLDAGLHDPDVLALASNAMVRLRRFVQAAPLLAQLREVAPSIAVYQQLIDCYTALADSSALAALCEDVLALDNSPIEVLQLQLRLLNTLSRHAECIPLCQSLLELAPREPEYWCMLGWHQQGCGQLEQAADSYRRALQIDPDNIRAHYALSQVDKARPAGPHLAALGRSLDAVPEARWNDRASLHSAMGKECEDLGEYERAFRHFKASADVMHGHSRYSAAADQRVLSAAGNWVEARLRAGSATGWHDDRPIFIVGLPRTGSTLLDRMLSSHSEVGAAGELLSFRAAVQELAGGSSRGDFFEHFFEQQSLQLDFQGIGRRYGELSRAAAGGCRHYTDKMPMNDFLLGLIALALPNARFLHTVRNPMDSCFSVFKQLFGRNYYNYSYDLRSVAQHYAYYRQLMKRWHDYFPGRILDVHYEEMVADPRRQMQRVLQHCGLEWQEECLEFHRNAAAVDTASSAQVRQPLYSSSVQKWRHYRPWLQPLIEALDEAGIDMSEVV